MQRTKSLRSGALIWVLALEVALTFSEFASAAEPTREGCKGFEFDLSSELALFDGNAQSIAASSALDDKSASIESGKLYAVTLVPEASLRFVLPPGRESRVAPAFAGLLKIAPVYATTILVTLNEGAWIELIDGKAIKSNRHTGSRDCSLLRKSVEFTVKPGTGLTLQISGSSRKEIRVGVTEHPGL